MTPVGNDKPRCVASLEIDVGVFHAAGQTRSGLPVVKGMCNETDLENVNAVVQKTAKEAARALVNANAVAIVTLGIAANHLQIVASIRQILSEVEGVPTGNNQKTVPAQIVHENQPKELDQVLMKPHHQENDDPALIVIKTLNRHKKSL